MVKAFKRISSNKYMFCLGVLFFVSIFAFFLYSHSIQTSNSTNETQLLLLEKFIDNKNWLINFKQRCIENECYPLEVSGRIKSDTTISGHEFWRLLAIGAMLATPTHDDINFSKFREQFAIILKEKVKALRELDFNTENVGALGINILSLEFLKFHFPELQDDLEFLVALGGDTVLHHLEFDYESRFSGDLMSSALATRNIARFSQIINPSHNPFKNINLGKFPLYARNNKNLSGDALSLKSKKISAIGLQKSEKILLNLPDITVPSHKQAVAEFLNAAGLSKPYSCWYKLAELEVLSSLNDKASIENIFSLLIKSDLNVTTDAILMMPDLSQAAPCIELLIEACERKYSDNSCSTALEIFERISKYYLDSAYSPICNGDHSFVLFQSPLNSTNRCKTNYKTVDTNAHMLWLKSRLLNKHFNGN